MQALIYWGAADTEAKEVRLSQRHSFLDRESLKESLTCVRSQRCQ